MGLGWKEGGCGFTLECGTAGVGQVLEDVAALDPKRGDGAEGPSGNNRSSYSVRGRIV